eukprot:jgi/Mesen1/3414/ME000192S02579
MRGGWGGCVREQSVKEMSAEMRRVRREMEEDEQVASLMRGLRGQNLSDQLFAADDVKMRLVQVKESMEIDEQLPKEYDPALIAAYWSRQPGSVATRIFQLLSVAGGFLSRIAGDIIFKKVKENEVKRAIELREIVTSLGPAYIKLGQALSIRPDVLSPAAMTELQKLCDKVPSFDNAVAMALIEEELGMPPSEIFLELSADPIAAASLGQVYKGVLRSSGDTVAVKVQRPFVLETVTVDLYIIRKLGVALRNVPQVVVPTTYAEYTSRRVLVTSWIEGEKLSQSLAADVGDLVNVGVICYLKQLLDTGFFHADPHPGNLIRTPDGKLCILDFGLVTKITDDQKYGMIEAISHLIHRDYEAIVADFVLLDFIPEGVDLTPIMPVLAKVFDQALEGGGAKGINFQELAADLAQITFDYPFRIPPYFALIIRAIGVLEGIALVGNPDFAIVDEAYPYIAQRLLTDPSPRLRAALKYTLYGRSDTFNADRFIDIMEAFETFAQAANTGGSQGEAGSMASLGAIVPVSVINAASSSSAGPAGQGHTRTALAFLFSDNGRFFREFVLDEIVKGIDALTREQLASVAVQLGLAPAPSTPPAFALPTFSLLPSLPTPPLLALPGARYLQNLAIPIPGALRPLPLVPTVTEQDRAVLLNVKRVVDFLVEGTPAARESRVGNVNAAELWRELLPVLPNVASQIAPEVALRLTSRVVARTIRELYLDP